MIVVADTPSLLQLGEAARRLGWSRGKMRQLVDAGHVDVDGVQFPLRSVQTGTGQHQPGWRMVREDDVTAVRAAIDAAIR